MGDWGFCQRETVSYFASMACQYNTDCNGLSESCYEAHLMSIMIPCTTTIALQGSSLMKDSIVQKLLSTSRVYARILLVVAAVSWAGLGWAQQAPPTLGQETKGVPAVDETSAQPSNTTEQTSEATADSADSDEPEDQSGIDSLLGKAEITESKRESGQIYRIELKHSSGAKQYIEEDGSDGKIESTSNDIEETPNLPKWRIGSW